jgi:hypothetical protein
MVAALVSMNFYSARAPAVERPDQLARSWLAWVAWLSDEGAACADGVDEAFFGEDLDGPADGSA